MRSDHHRDGAARAAGRGRRDLLAAAGVLAVGGGLLAGFGFTRSTSAASDRSATYRQQGRFSYSAPVDASSVYGRPSVTTGEPIYKALAPVVHVRFAYQLSASARAAVSGSDRLVATLSNGDGLTRTVPLAPTTRFSGERVVAEGTLRLASLERIAEQFDAAGGGQVNGSYGVTIDPSVRVQGTVGGGLLATSFDPGLSFSLSPEGLSLSSSSSGGGAAGGGAASAGAGAGLASAAASPLAPSSSGVVQLAPFSHATTTGYLRVSSLRVSVEDARVAGLVVLGLALLLGTASGWSLLSDLTAADERRRIAARYSSLLVEARVLPTTGVTVVELETIDDVVHLAERLECPLLHQAAAGGGIEVPSGSGHANGSDQYAVLDNGTLYRYCAPLGSMTLAEADEASTARRAHRSHARAKRAPAEGPAVSGAL